MIPPTRPYFLDRDIEEIIAKVEKVLRSGMLSLTGEAHYYMDFEREFAKLCGAKYAISTNSGASALEVAMRSWGLSERDEVLVPTNTFSASASTVIFTGAKPILTDINPKTLCIDMDNIEKSITSKTSAVMVVHIGGLVCPEIEEIRKYCEDMDLFLIEDAAHAHGSTLNGRHAGVFGQAGCFSFYPTKIMTTGEGGMITTNDNYVAERAKKIRDCGREKTGSVIITELGNNWRMAEINACIGLVQLRRLREIIEKRRKIAQLYDTALTEWDTDAIKPLMIDSKNTNYYKYVALLDKSINRDLFKQQLLEKGVRCGGEVYSPPLHLQPIYQRLLNVKSGDFPTAERVCKKMLCPPLYPAMSVVDAMIVINKILEVLQEGNHV